jgi:hypothetical protein
MTFDERVVLCRVAGLWLFVPAGAGRSRFQTQMLTENIYIYIYIDGGKGALSARECTAASEQGTT